MSSATGSRCNIFDLIDGIDSAADVKELARKLKPILHELAYLAINSDGAIGETQEEWHEDFNTSLRREAAVAVSSSSSARRAPRVDDAKDVDATFAHSVSARADPRSRDRAIAQPRDQAITIAQPRDQQDAKPRSKPMRAPRARDRPTASSLRASSSSGPSALLEAEPAHRKKQSGGTRKSGSSARADDIPDSLRAIMSGTHQSLREHDNGDDDTLAARMYGEQ